MRVTAVGCAGSFPGPESPASCYLVQSELAGRTWSIVLDLGNGSLGTLQRYVDPCRLDAVVLSHLHPDHCLDLCSLYVMLTYRPRPGLVHVGAVAAVVDPRLPVYAPTAAPDRMARAYGVEKPESLEDRYAFHRIGDRARIQIGPFVVTPYAVNHPVEAYGLRVEADGAVLAYTGDTDSCPALADLCRDATLVLADCAFVDGRDEPRGIHMSGSRAAEAAVAAGGVRRLMLTHMPSWNDPQVCVSQAARVWAGTIEVCRPGGVYDL